MYRIVAMIKIIPPIKASFVPNVTKVIASVNPI
jgi:flagellar biosynthesis protein FliR